ncbi:ATP-binding protein [Streptomyces sp. OfavH-34-F]|uniref:ATP-binding protein n=1 Tax=Streptomyces sp. OfavH-34-F TaxID=2917760 RepID=UPI001EF1EE78|nr:ATP-binding protein [Streptomyces sp. OfavH-34-F]MCG7524438.1 ATP-binding protein [Streptomyces sp. OfavH-34-F]
MTWLSYAGGALAVPAAVACAVGWIRERGRRLGAEGARDEALRRYRVAASDAETHADAVHRLEGRVRSEALAVGWWRSRYGELSEALGPAVRRLEERAAASGPSPHGEEPPLDARRFETLVHEVLDQARDETEDAERRAAALRASALAGVRTTAEQMHTALTTAQVAVDQALEQVASEAEQAVLRELDRCVSQAGHAVQRLRLLSDAWPGVQRADCTVEEIVEGARARTVHFDLVRWVPGEPGDVWVQGRVAEPAAMVLAELLDNAATYSGRPVEVRAAYVGGPVGGVRVTVRDQGLGMTRGELDRARATLACGRELDATRLDGAQQLGLLVAGRLSALYGLPVRLESAEGGGVLAALDIGPHHFAEIAEPPLPEPPLPESPLPEPPLPEPVTAPPAPRTAGDDADGAP